MIPVPELFRPKDIYTYPPNNTTSFEEYFYNYAKDLKTEREYLPVMWTAFYKNGGYGTDAVRIAALQNYLHTLNRDQPLYTVVQYDDGIINDISKFTDLKVYSMVGKGDYELPLISQPQPYSFTDARDIFASFIGGRTHKVRDFILDELIKDNRYYICGGGHLPINYARIMAKSVFALCPRGYSPTSFRICEALQYGAIPVYISDVFTQPHGVDFEAYGILINDESKIDEVLQSVPFEKIKQLQKKGREIYEKYYTFKSNAKLIIDSL